VASAPAIDRGTPWGFAHSLQFRLAMPVGY
jgi:hypothetical protein